MGLLDYADQMAQQYGLDPAYVRSVVMAESGGRADVVSPKGAIGPMQLMPATAKYLGVDPNDPQQNIEGGVRFLRQNMDQFGDPALAAAAYNAGPGAVKKYGGVPPYAETQAYVRKVMAGAGGAAPFSQARGSVAGQSGADIFGMDGAASPQSPPSGGASGTGEDIFGSVKTQPFVVPSMPQPQEQPATAPDAAQTDASKPTIPMKDMFERAAGNLLPSAVNYGKNMWDALSSPMQTIDGAAAMIRGGINAARPGTLQIPNAPTDDQAFDAMKGFLKDRYGGAGNIQETIANDPVGALADASLLFNSAGGLAEAGGLAKTAKLAKMGGAVTDPLNIATAPAYAAYKAALTPEKLYGAALKPSTTLRPDERAAVIGTGLSEGIPVNAAGAEKLRNRMDSTAKRMDPILEAADAAGKTIDPMDVAARTVPLIDMASNTVTPAKNMAPIGNVVGDFLSAYWPEKLGVKQANDIKQNTYRTLSKTAYGELKGMDTEAQKALARGLKEEVAAAAPDVVPLNDYLSQAMDLRTQLDRALGRTGNWDPIGMGGLLGISAGRPGVGGLLSVARLPDVLSTAGIYGDRLRGLLDPYGAGFRSAVYGASQMGQ